MRLFKGKNTLYFLSLLILLISISGCRKQYEWRDDYFLFGYVPYDCEADDCCWYYLLLNEKVFRDDMESGYNKGSYFGKSKTAYKKPTFKLFSKGKKYSDILKNLRDSLPLDYLLKDGKVAFGDFDNHPGTFIIELKQNNKVSRWHFAQLTFDPPALELKGLYDQIDIALHNLPTE